MEDIIGKGDWINLQLYRYLTIIQLHMETKLYPINLRILCNETSCVITYINYKIQTIYIEFIGF